MKLTPLLSKSAGLAALATGVALVAATPQAKAACLGPNSPCTSFDPSTPTTLQDVPFTGTISASAGANSQLDDVSVQFTLNPNGQSFAFPFTLTNIIVKNLPIGQPPNNTITDWTFPDITFANFNDSGNYVGTALNTPKALSSFTGGSNITSPINFATSGTKISYTIPAGVAAGGASFDVNLLYGRTGTGTSASSDILSATAQVPGPLPILGAASAFGFSRSIRRRIKLSKLA